MFAKATHRTTGTHVGRCIMATVLSRQVLRNAAPTTGDGSTIARPLPERSRGLMGATFACDKKGLHTLNDDRRSTAAFRGSDASAA